MKIADTIIDNVNISENAFLFNNVGYRNEDFNLILHSINVTILSLKIGISKNYRREKLEKLVLGALLHDVGKLFNEGRDHCKIGYELIKSKSNIPVTSCLCILHHHENEDGTGFPEKVKGDKMHEFVKIVSICNEYNNLLQSGKLNLPTEALEYIAAITYKRFDKEIYNDFINSIYCYPNGLYVKLSNGLIGTVVLQNKGFPARPMIGIIENGSPYICNLLNDLTLFIKEVAI